MSLYDFSFLHWRYISLGPIAWCSYLPLPSLIPMTRPVSNSKSSNGFPLSTQEDETAWCQRPKCSLHPSLPDQFLSILQALGSMMPCTRNLLSSLLLSWDPWFLPPSSPSQAQSSTLCLSFLIQHPLVSSPLLRITSIARLYCVCPRCQRLKYVSYLSQSLQKPWEPLSPFHR